MQTFRREIERGDSAALIAKHHQLWRSNHNRHRVEAVPAIAYDQLRSEARNSAKRRACSSSSLCGICSGGPRVAWRYVARVGGNSSTER